MLKKLFLLMLLGCFLTTQGCLAAAVGYTGYAVSKSKSEAADKEAESRLVDSYTRYKSDAEKANIERQKMGQKPEPIKSFAEWKLAYNIPSPAPEPKAAKPEKEKEESASK